MFVNAASQRNSAKNSERPFRNSWQMNHPAQTNSVQPYCHLLMKYRFLNGHSTPLLCMQPSHVYKLVLTALDDLRCSPRLGLASHAFLKSLFTAMKAYREIERERRVKNKRVMRDNFTRGKEEQRLVQGSQASLALPSVRSNMKKKMYEEDIIMVTVAARNKGREILISR